MPDPKAAQPKGKRTFDLSDIMSMLGDDGHAPATNGAREQPAPEPGPVIKVVRTVSADLKGPERAPEPPRPGAADPSIVDRLLADFGQKNEEILRLSSEMMQLKFDLKEKDRKIGALTAVEAALDSKEEAIRDRDASIKDKEATIREKEVSLKEKEAALKEKDAVLKERDAILKEKEALLREIEMALSAKDAEVRTYEARVRELEAKIEGMAEQMGTLRRFSARESSHEPFEVPAAEATEEQQHEAAFQEQPPAAEDDVAAIFKRLAGASAEETEDGEDKEPPRKPRSAKLYDL